MWFNSYGWKNNPFYIKPDSNVVGLEKEREQLKNYVSNGNICLLKGTYGSGKTNLLLWLEKNVKKHWVYYLNAETLYEFNIEQFLKEHTKYLRKIFGYDHPKNTVLLIDEAQHLSDQLRKELKFYFDKGHIKSIVFSFPAKKVNLKEELKQRIGERIIELQGLSKEGVFDLIRFRSGDFIPFTEDASHVIFSQSPDNTRKILELCEQICMKLQGKKEITSDDVNFTLGLKKPLIQSSTHPPQQLEKEIVDMLSPMEKKILELLKETEKTVEELSAILQTSEGSIGKQLSKLRMKNLIKITREKRPKVYGLA